MKATCPHCGSHEIRSNDLIAATCDVDSWNEDGTPNFTSNGSEIHWDATGPANEDLPYECADCFKGISEAQILASLTEDETEDEDA